MDKYIDSEYIKTDTLYKEKNFISSLPREEFDNIIDNIDDVTGNNLIKELELSEITIEVHKGYPEEIKFCHFRDVDNNIDYSLRKYRNKMAKDIIYEKISQFKPLEKKFRKFFETKN
jgi:hypothetical protein